MYFWKVLTPSFEFGAMHVVLFQLALLPLTMSRFFITKLSQTSMKHVIPFHNIMGMHYYLGYFMVFTVFFTTVFFFIFFGQLCYQQNTGREPLDGDGNKSFCLKFTSEVSM